MADLGERERELLEDAASWRLLGLAFERPKTDWIETIRSIAQERSIDQAVVSMIERAVDEGSEASYLAAFGPGGQVSPREVSYRRMGDPGRILAELKIMYDAFAFMPQTEETPDHVSVEVGFVGFLRLKEAYALMMGDEETARIVREASKVFLSEHLAYLVVGLEGRLGDSYLLDASEVLRDRIGQVPADIAVTVSADVESFDCASGCSFGAE